MSWEFNEEVATNFDYIADTSIPKYRIILYKTIEIIKENLPKDAKILEIGCANGNTMRLLKNAGFYNVLGIDNSQAMIDKCKQQEFVVELADDFPTWTEQHDAIIANWTLHFIVERSRREQYIQEIYNNLKPGGIFILSEKVQGPETEYLDFKRANFLSEKDIAYKKDSLKGILEPWDSAEYLKLFSDIGFESTTIINETFCFSTFLIKK